MGTAREKEKEEDNLFFSASAQKKFSLQFKGEKKEQVEDGQCSLTDQLCVCVSLSLLLCTVCVCVCVCYFHCGGFSTTSVIEIH